MCEAAQGKFGLGLKDDKDARPHPRTDPTPNLKVNPNLKPTFNLPLTLTLTQARTTLTRPLTLTFSLGVRGGARQVQTGPKERQGRSQSFRVHVLAVTRG